MWYLSSRWLIVGRDHFAGVRAGLLGNADTTEHARNFFETLIRAEGKNRSRSLVTTAGFFDAEMMVRLGRDLGQVGHA